MRTTIIASAALALTSTAAFAGTGESSFTKAGNTYVYSTKTEHGRTVISGRQLPSGERFRLVVDGRRVTGESAGQPVSFRTETARGAAGGVQVASN